MNSLPSVQEKERTHLVFGAINHDFSQFIVSEDLKSNILNYPPISVPYGEVTIPATANAIIYQKIGSITTGKPLLYLNEVNGVKSAFLLGEGIWKWRMQEYALNESTESFDELFSKTIQYLSTKVDKRKFKCYPTANEYTENQTVIFRSEVYNEIYERTYGLPIQITVKGEKEFVKDFSYSPSSAYSQLEMSNFPPGLYEYVAKVRLDNKNEIVRGKFTVAELQLERLDQVADFNLLRHVANNTGGEFYKLSQADEMLRDVDNIQLQGIIHTQEDVFPLINLKWIFYILLLLVTIEWFTRKFNGGY